MTEKLLAVENQLRGVQEEQQKTAGKLLEVTEKNNVYEVSCCHQDCTLKCSLLYLNHNNTVSQIEVTGILYYLILDMYCIFLIIHIILTLQILIWSSLMNHYSSILSVSCFCMRKNVSERESSA